MMATDTERTEPVTVVLEEGVPVRLDRGGERFYVDEPPEPRGRLIAAPRGSALDPSMVTGWRIVATAVGGERHVFDVISCGARWWLTRLDA